LQEPEAVIEFELAKKEKVMRNHKGFTLIEVLLVVVILGVMVMLAVPRLTGRGEKAKITLARVGIETIGSALKLYELDNGNFPTTNQGLAALMRKPGTAPMPRNWNGPYLEKEPLDPWGQPYQYKYPGSRGVGYDLFSYGPEENNEEGWICNWK